MTDVINQGCVRCLMRTVVIGANVSIAEGSVDFKFDQAVTG